MGGVFSVWGIG